MRIKPILFSTPMVQAILDGRKTQTRRIIKPIPIPEYFKIGGEFPEHLISCSESEAQIVNFRSPKTGRACIKEDASKIYNGKGAKYQKGDILWVREAYCKSSVSSRYFYRANLEPQGWKFKWKPSIYMPKEAARIFLKVTNVRIERLQDISGKDAIAEGVEAGLDMDGKYKPMYRNYLANKKDKLFAGVVFDARTSFRTLWQKINGPGAWNENPYVWVYEFGRVEKPENF